jgi:hypothetical protein
MITGKEIKKSFLFLKKRNIKDDRIADLLIVKIWATKKRNELFFFDPKI